MICKYDLYKTVFYLGNRLNIRWNWTQYQQVKQILNWYKTGMHHDCRLNWLNNFSLLYQSYIMHQNVLMGLGHTESRVTTNLLTLIFWWLQQMGAYSPAWRYRWNIVIGPSCFTIPSNTTFFTEFLWHSCSWDHISFVFTALWDHISSTMSERFLNLHKMMVAVEQKTKQNGNIFLIVLMKSLSTKTIQLTRSIWAFHDQIAKKFLLNHKDPVAGSLEFYKNIRVKWADCRRCQIYHKEFWQYQAI